MKLKRLMMLALCLALVCAMSVTVFADDSYTRHKDYDDGTTWVEVHGEITQYATSGFSEGDSIHDQSSTYVAVEYAYYQANMSVKENSDSCTREGMSYVGKTFASGTIVSMYYAYYDFWAQVMTNTGLELFEASSGRLEY